MKVRLILTKFSYAMELRNQDRDTYLEDRNCAFITRATSLFAVLYFVVICHYMYSGIRVIYKLKC